MDVAARKMPDGRVGTAQTRSSATVSPLLLYRSSDRRDHKKSGKIATFTATAAPPQRAIGSHKSLYYKWLFFIRS